MQSKFSNTAYRQIEAEAMQTKHSNTDCRKQKAGVKCKKCLDPHQKQKEAAVKHSNLVYRKQEA